MKLSEAIRKGALMKPQGFGPSTMFGAQTCALGAACEGVGLAPTGAMEAYNEVMTRWPMVMEPVSGPCPGMESVPLLHKIYRLNDGYYNGRKCWTREDIADWVELVEDEEELKAQGFGLTPDL